MSRKSAYLRREPKRDGGTSTRAQLLEVAGEVFGDKGFASTTGKMIAERSGCNSAAINYHFGGMGELYAEVLVEAHHRLVSYEELATLARSAGDAAEKLSAFIPRLTQLSLASGPAAWPLRVISREILSPSQFFPILMEREVLPKKRIAMELVAEYLGVKPDDPVTGIALLSFVAPYLALLIGNPQMLRNIAPTLFEGQDELQELIKKFQAFSFGGLTAMKELLAKDRAADKAGGHH